MNAAKPQPVASLDAERLRTAAEQYRTDPRFRQMVDSCAHFAHEDHGPPDPHKASRDAVEIATLACALLLARIYTEDAEIRMLRAERDHYRQIAMRAAVLSPLVLGEKPQQLAKSANIRCSRPIPRARLRGGTDASS